MSKVNNQNNIRRSVIQWTAKGLKKQMEKGRVNFDNAVQRNFLY